MRVSSKPKDSRAYTCIDETAPVINISHAESITLITYTDWTDDLGEYWSSGTELMAKIHLHW